MDEIQSLLHGFIVAINFQSRVCCALKGTAEGLWEDPITRALWDALASWRRECDADELRRRVLRLVGLLGYADG